MYRDHVIVIYVSHEIYVIYIAQSSNMGEGLNYLPEIDACLIFDLDNMI